jgi:hypothetical protein
MHIKFLRHGTGSASGAVSYLLADKDHLGVKRAEVKVLRGNPALVASVADNLDFVHRYSSGVLSWAPEEQPDDDEIDGVLKDVEQAFTSGLDPDRLAWTAVLHREKNGACHVHLLAARVDLATGKSYNPAPPGWQKTFDPLRDAWNWEQGWARPDDPLRARLYQPGHRALIEASARRAELAAEEDPKGEIAEKITRRLAAEEDPKGAITRYLVQRIEAGAVRDRSEMVEALKEAGLQVNRQGKDYLSVVDPETGKKYRLKGAIYGADFTPEACRELGRQAEQEDRGGRQRGGERDEGKARHAREEFERALERIAGHNNKRYRRPAEVARETLAADVDRESRNGHGVDPGDADRARPVRDVGIAPGAGVASAGDQDQSRSTEAPAAVPDDPERGKVVSGGAPDQLQPDDRHHPRPKRRRRKDPAIKERLEDDRAREPFSKSLGYLERVCRWIGEAIGRYDQELSATVEANGSFVGAVKEYRKRAQSLNAGLGDREARSATLGSAVDRLAGSVEQRITLRFIGPDESGDEELTEQKAGQGLEYGTDR